MTTSKTMYIPADAAGTITLGGDLIIAIDGEKVQDEQDLSQMMDNHRAGDTVKVTIYRNKKKMEVSVALGEARQQV